MDTVQGLETQRTAILEEMRSMRSMEKGGVYEQYLKVRIQGQKEPALRGPYFLVCRKEEGKTKSRRLTSREEVERARRDVETYQRYVALCEEFLDVTHRLGGLERQEGEASREKKRPRSRSSRIGR